jgi:hypothetical protein
MVLDHRANASREKQRMKSTKCQGPSSRETSRFKAPELPTRYELPRDLLGVGCWMLDLPWCLEFGFWSFFWAIFSRLAAP